MGTANDGSHRKCLVLGVCLVLFGIVLLYYIGVSKSPANGIQSNANLVTSYSSSNGLVDAKEEKWKDEDRSDPTRPIPKHQVILCMVFTTPEQWERRALAVRLTWIKRCDYYAFFYSKKDGVHLYGAYALDVPEGRDHLTAKTMLAYRVSYQQYKDVVDWYLKADDDTYFIMENLRHLLNQYNPNLPFYLGHKSTDFLRNGYNSGGAGYVLSKAAVQLVVEKGDSFPNSCVIDGAIEDLDMGKCLETFRVYPMETRDSQNRIKFHPDHPIKLLLGDHDALSVYQFSKENYTFGHHQGIKVMSEEMVSFHYMEPGYLYMYDFLLYDLKRNWGDVS